MNRDLLELYIDYLLSAFSYTTATDLSRMTDGVVSHDKVTRFLAEKELGPPRFGVWSSRWCAGSKRRTREEANKRACCIWSRAARRSTTSG